MSGRAQLKHKQAEPFSYVFDFSRYFEIGKMSDFSNRDFDLFRPENIFFDNFPICPNNTQT